MSAEYDFFISHASEDKEAFVDALVNGLLSADASVWYDEFSLKPGDSLRREIDRGLAQSKLGIVVLSPRFFNKEWPQKELGGLMGRENAGQIRIVPVLLDITIDEVRIHSPTLTDKMALDTAEYTTAQIVDKLIELKNELAMPRTDAAGGSRASQAETP